MNLFLNKLKITSVWPKTGMKYSQLLETFRFFLLLLLFFENELRLLTEIIDNIISFISWYQIVQIRLCKDRPKDFARSWGTANQLWVYVTLTHNMTNQQWCCWLHYFSQSQPTLFNFSFSLFLIFFPQPFSSSFKFLSSQPSLVQNNPPYPFIYHHDSLYENCGL